MSDLPTAEQVATDRGLPVSLVKALARLSHALGDPQEWDGESIEVALVDEAVRRLRAAAPPDVLLQRIEKIVNETKYAAETRVEIIQGLLQPPVETTASLEK